MPFVDIDLCGKVRSSPSVQLEYIGGQPGTRTYRGPETGRLYRFGDNEGHRVHLVEVGDAPHLLNLAGQFVQVGVPSTPPPQIQVRLLRNEVEALKKQLEQARAAPSTSCDNCDNCAKLRKELLFRDADIDGYYTWPDDSLFPPSRN